MKFLRNNNQTCSGQLGFVCSQNRMNVGLLVKTYSVLLCSTHCAPVFCPFYGDISVIYQIRYHSPTVEVVNSIQKSFWTFLRQFYQTPSQSSGLYWSYTVGSMGPKRCPTLKVCCYMSWVERLLIQRMCLTEKHNHPISFRKQTHDTTRSLCFAKTLSSIRSSRKLPPFYLSLLHRSHSVVLHDV